MHILSQASQQQRRPLRSAAFCLYIYFFIFMLFTHFNLLGGLLISFVLLLTLFFLNFVLFTHFYILCCSLITSLSVGSQCSVLLIQPQSSDCPRKAKRNNSLITLCWQFWILNFCVLPEYYSVLLTDFILLLLTKYSHDRLIAQEFDWLIDWYIRWFLIQSPYPDCPREALALSRKMAKWHDTFFAMTQTKQNGQYYYSHNLLNSQERQNEVKCSKVKKMITFPIVVLIPLDVIGGKEGRYIFGQFGYEFKHSAGLRF